MKAAAILLAASLLPTAAMAWTNTNTGHNNQIVDGGPGVQANPVAKGGRGGAGGTATGGNASGGSATAQGGSVAVLGLAGGNSDRVAPSINLPSIGGGGSDCPTVGFGAGGAGLGGGGGFGPSWISSDCNKRRVASLLAELYGVDVARAYASREIAGVAEAVAAAGVTTKRVSPPDWCYTRDAGNLHQQRICEVHR